MSFDRTISSIALRLESQKFRVGDRVRITTPAAIDYCDDVGEVIDSNGLFYQVRMDIDGNVLSLQEIDFTLENS